MSCLPARCSADGKKFVIDSKDMDGYKSSSRETFSNVPLAFLFQINSRHALYCGELQKSFQIHLEG